ncbi:MAG: hypothetical protein QXW47_10350 [Candidatus Jordarchaeales archaeon]
MRRPIAVFLLALSFTLLLLAAPATPPIATPFTPATATPQQTPQPKETQTEVISVNISLSTDWYLGFDFHVGPILDIDPPLATFENLTNALITIDVYGTNLSAFIGVEFVNVTESYCMAALVELAKQMSNKLSTIGITQQSNSHQRVHGELYCSWILPGFPFW